MADHGNLSSPPPKLPPKHSAPSFREKKDVLGRANLDNKPVPKPRIRTKLSNSPQTESCQIDKNETIPSNRPIPRPRTRDTFFPAKQYLESDLDSVPVRDIDDISKRETDEDIYINSMSDNIPVSSVSEIIHKSGFKIPPDANEAGRIVEDIVNAEYENHRESNNTGHEQFVQNNSNNTNSKNIPVQRVEAIQRTSAQPGMLDSQNNIVHTGSPVLPKQMREYNPDKQPIYDIQEFIGNRPEKSTFSSEILIPFKVPQLPAVQENTDLVFVPGTSKGETSSDPETESREASRTCQSLDDSESKYEPVWFTDVPKASQVKADQSDLLTFSTKNKQTPSVFADHKASSSNILKISKQQNAEPGPRSRDTVAKLNITEQWGEYAKLDPNASITYLQPPPMHAPPPLPNIVLQNVAPPVPPRPVNDASANKWARSNTGNSCKLKTWDPSGNIQPNDSIYSFESPPSAVFQQLETPQNGFYQDDPFKYSDFAAECADFNKASQSDLHTTGRQQVGGTLAPASLSDFDPFSLKGETTDNVSQNSWTSAASSSSSDVLRMSMVPPPPEYQTFTNQDISVASLYSLACDSVPDVDSSDSSDEVYIKTGVPVRNTGMGMPVPIVSSPTPKASERYGYLHKQGGVKANKGWKRRWVVFNGSDLRYYVNNKSHISKRIIPLSCMKEVRSEVQKSDKDKFKFSLDTKLGSKGRTFQFCAETLEDCLTWCNILMAAISMYQKNHAEGEETDDATADKQGFVRFEPGRKFYVSITGSRLCYYHSFEDYKLHSPIHEIRMELASVKDLPGNRQCKLQLTTNYAQFILAFENATETQHWKMAMEDAIAEGLADDSVLMTVYKNDSNKICADCEEPNPHWASVNLGIVLCKKCAGIHRMFDYRISKIRSLRMDTRVWTPSLIEMMISIGNANANNFWEFDLLAEQKIESNCSETQRKQFIQDKYKEKKFIRPHQHQHDVRILNEELLLLAQTDKLLDVMAVLLSGANIRYKRPDCKDEDLTAYNIAKEAGQRLVMEFLYQNGGDSSSSQLQDTDDGRLREDVRLQGHLMKTGPSNRGFENRWCILEHGALTYYEKVESTKSKDSIDRKTILCLQETAAGNDKQIAAFELSTTKGTNRIYLFGAENNAERGMWMRTIARLICPVSVMDHVGMMDFCLAGNFYMKTLITDEWTKTWLMLNWRVLHFVGTNSELDSVDLRKAKGIKYVDAESCSKCMESGKHFVIDTPGRHLYFQADLVRDTERAFNALKNAIKMSGASLSDQQLTADDVPVIVSRCIEYIHLNGLKDKGIYRESATGSKIESLLERLKQDVYSVKLEEATCNEVANALKRFFRQLEDSLFTRDLYSEWVRTASTTDMNNKLSWYRYLRDKLPLVNKNTLKKLILHLCKVSQNFQTNSMSVENLATCFAPSLMRTDSDNDHAHAAGLPLEMAVVTDLIKNRDYIFDIQASDNHKDNVIDEAAAKIAAVNLEHSGRPVSNVISHMMIPFHVMDSNGQSLNETVHSEDTAEDVLNRLQRRLHKSEDFVIYEVLKRGAIERPMLSSENPLFAMLDWQHWEDDITKEAKFIVKSSQTLKDIANAYQPGVSLFGELKCAAPGDKKLKKMSFKFIQSRLSCYKDSKANHAVDEWNVEDLIFYLGIDPKRSGGVSASQCITFVKKSEKQKGCFGYCLVFPSSEEKLRWMSALMTAQNSGKNLT